MGSESQPEPTPAGRRRPELEPRRGMRLGRYELLTLLASGGMAQVFIARLAGQHGFERLVALKTMRPEHAESDAFRRMFLDEAQLAARIRHVNVVEVLDLGDEQGIVYQAMTLVEGDSVAALLRRRRQLGARGLPHGVAARIVADVLSGLHAAHELTDADGRALHIVHRDVSPQNVLVSVDGIAKIADFGIAKARLRLADETDAGQIKGKFAYMAPEQLERRTTDRRADVFSTGVMLWEALTGKRLFGGIDLIETIAKLRESDIPDPRSVAPELPAELAAVTMHALARDPAQRFATAAAMSDALDRAASECGAVTTTKEVGALVADLCAEELDRRREAVGEAVRAVTRGGPVATAQASTAPAPDGVTAATTVADARTSSLTRRPGARTLGVVAVAAVLVGAVVLVAVGGAWRASRTVVTSGSGPASASAPPSPAVTGLPPAAESASVSASASSSAAAASEVVSAAPTAAAPPRAPKAPRAAGAPVAPHVKYGNTYGP